MDPEWISHKTSLFLAFQPADSTRNDQLHGIRRADVQGGHIRSPDHGDLARYRIGIREIDDHFIFQTDSAQIFLGQKTDFFNPVSLISTRTGSLNFWNRPQRLP